MALPRPGRITALVAAVSLGTGSLCTVSLPFGHGTAAAETSEAPTPNGSTVTLLTGDQVTTYGKPGSDRQRTKVRPGPGREDIRFATYRDSGHLHVIPSDAAELGSSGALDERLFDVTTLRESGYADSASDELPLLMSGRATDTSGTTITQALPSIAGSALRAVKSELGDVWESLTDTGTSATGTTRTLSSGVNRIWLDGKRSASLDRSAAQIGAPQAWDSGVTGRGVTVAVLDTGVDQTHPDLADREVGQRNFSDAQDNADHFGHGTHVAGIVAGTGAFSDGKYQGIAHGANILDGKVLNDSGSGRESSIIAGLEWAAEQNADIANLSLGGGDTPEIDPLEKAVNDLSADNDTLYVVAAGNEGPSPETVGSPGSADAALTVGAVNRQDGLAPFSSRGPRVGDAAIKPDITAPGVGIVSALHSDGTIGKPVDGRYTKLDGTSMATPHVAGAAALVAQAHPRYTGEQLKAALTASARPNPELTAFQQGSGRVDVPAALNQSMTTGPTSLSFGTQRWPHEDDEPVTKELTYHNHGDRERTLELSAQAKGPGGQRAPAGVFTVDRPRVTIPAGGSATVRVTADTSGNAPTGTYSGNVVATGGQTRIHTPMAVIKEIESYDLTINHVGPRGNPVRGTLTQVIEQNRGNMETVSGAEPSRTIRLPRGHYLLNSLLTTGGQDDPHSSLLVRPGVELTEDTTVELDFGEAKPVEVSPPKQAGEPLLGTVGYNLTSGDRSQGFTLLGMNFQGLSTGHLGPALPEDRFTANINGEWAGKRGSYHLAWFEPGKLPTGFRRSVERRELAEVRHEFGAAGSDRAGGLGSIASTSGAGPGSAGMAVIHDVSIPGSHTGFYNTDGVRWSSRLSGDGSGTLVQSPPTAYRPGEQYRQRYNHAPFAPGFPASVGNDPGWAIRDGNDLVVTLPLFSDGDGNAVLSGTAKGRMTLHRGDELVGESSDPQSGAFTVPAEPGRYRLAAEATRPGGPELSPRVSASWTFDSAHAGAIRALPLSAVRFQPELDENNSAPAGQHDEVPVSFQNAHGEQEPFGQLAVQVSYDGGKNWTEAPVLGGEKVALDYPDGATSVSLRARASDQDGNTVTQTVIDAYRLRS